MAGEGEAGLVVVAGPVDMGSGVEEQAGDVERFIVHLAAALHTMPVDCVGDGSGVRRSIV